MYVCVRRTPEPTGPYNHQQLHTNQPPTYKAGHVSTARLLLARGAPVAAVDGNGSSALLLACLEGQLEAAELLVEEAKVGWFVFFLRVLLCLVC